MRHLMRHFAKGGGGELVDGESKKIVNTLAATTRWVTEQTGKYVGRAANQHTG